MNIPTEAQLRAQLAAIERNGLLALFTAGVAKHDPPVGLSLAFVLAVGSRETELQNILGDFGHGRGILQIDDRAHKEFCRQHNFRTEPGAFIDYGCSILAGNLAWARETWPHYMPGQHIKEAADAYNEGRGGEVRSVRAGNADLHTAHNDYGSDVCARMEIFERLLTP